ncbi:MAG TPA: ACP phosphodiesterase [Edaphocola sp.]|nr:ACP phosphodiesterase [Edaphocola sp.]
MNLLGHAFLSFDNDAVLCGNMMGDFIKGKKILTDLPGHIRQGALLHRKIDDFTDRHPAIRKAKNIFRADYRLYAGPVMDIILDHYLANDPKFFPSDEALRTYTNSLYKRLEKNKAYQPERFQTLLRFLETHEIIYQYRTLNGLKKALENLCKRMKYSQDPAPAWQNTMRYYYELNQYYFDFIEDIFHFAKKELKDNS